MKTYACGKCGDRVKLDDAMDIPCCGSVMHELDGIISGGGVKQIWRDGQMVWQGNHVEAVEWIAGHLKTNSEQASEADRIVRLLGYARYLPTWSPPEAVDALRAAVVYVAKYYKT